MKQYIDSLIDKYFKAETTLEEEKRLKRYFCYDEVLPEHEMYRDLFTVFDEKSKEVLPTSADKPIQVRVTKSKKFLRYIFYPTGVVAAVFLLVLLIPKEKEVSYAMIHGKRIEDKEFIQSYTEAELEKVNSILSRGLNPLNNLEKTMKKIHSGVELIENTEQKIINSLKFINDEKNNDASCVPDSDGSNSKRTNA